MKKKNIICLLVMSQIIPAGCSILSSRYPPDPDFDSRTLTDHILYGNYLKYEFTLEQVDTMLTSESYENRAIAATVLGYGHVADTATCLELMVRTLGMEMENPFSTEPSVEISEPITDFLKGQYLYASRYLVYKKGHELLKPYIEKSEGDLRSLLMIIAGLTGEKCVRSELREIYRTSRDGYIRIQATRVMNIYPDKRDIPVLTEALNDDYHTTDRYGNRMSSVATNARCALLRLGYTLENIEKMRNYEN